MQRRGPSASPSSPILVPGDGPLPCPGLIVGERPAREEAYRHRPFVGNAGAELGRFIRRADWRIENLVSTWTGTVDNKPTEEEIADPEIGAPALERIIDQCQPSLIVPTGLFSTRYFLGPWATMELCHGLVYEAPGRPGTLILPVYHPAAALRQPERYQKPLVADFRCVKEVRAALDRGTDLSHIEIQDHPDYSANERYLTVDGSRPLAGLLDRHVDIVAIDREGEADDPQCFTAALGGRAGFLFRCDDRAAMTALAALVDKASLVVFHQALDDLRSLNRHGIHIPAQKWADTMVMAYVIGDPLGLKTLAYRRRGRLMSDYEDLVIPLDEDRVRHALERAVRKFHGRWLLYGVPKRILTSLTGMLTRSADERLRKRWEKSSFAVHVPLPPEASWRDLPEEVGRTYACVDAIETRALYRPLKQDVEALGLMPLYEIDRGIVPFLGRISDIGLKVDAAQLTALADVLDTEFDACCRTLTRVLGYEVNPLSPVMVSDALDEEGIDLPRNYKSGHRKTGDKYLQAAKADHAAVPLIIDGREINKMRGTYARKLPTLLKEGRYHPDFRYTATATGRLAEEIILLIPKHSDRGKKIRKAFVADDGNVLLSTDLSQIEMRVMARESGEPTLIDVYRRGGDVHADTAWRVLGAPKKKEDQDESKHRLPAKTVNFGIINAMTEYGLSEQLTALGLEGWDVEATREFIGAWWQARPGVERYRRRQVNQARRLGYVEDMYRRRIYVEGIKSSDDRIRARAERQCLSGIQSGAQGIGRIWMARVWEMIQRRTSRGYLEPWLFLHDDLIVECRLEMSAGLQTRIQQLMPQALGDIPVTGESKHAESWGTLPKEGWSL